MIECPICGFANQEAHIAGNAAHLYKPTPPSYLLPNLSPTVANSNKDATSFRNLSDKVDSE
jgi:hypothetical protein